MSFNMSVGKLVRFGRDKRGVSAVEFALIAPLMVGMYLGCVEVSQGIAADRKVSLVAAALANLTAHVSSISSTGMTNILDASSAIISPYDASKLKITISCISIDASKKATVKWSVTRNGTALSGTPTLPDALTVASTQLIFAQASYSYTPTVGYTITGSLTLSDQMYMAPRISAPSYAGTSCT